MYDDTIFSCDSSLKVLDSERYVAPSALACQPVCKCRITRKRLAIFLNV